MTPTGPSTSDVRHPPTYDHLRTYDRPVADNPTFGNEPKNKD